MGSVVICPMCSGTGSYSTLPSGGFFGQTFFGSESELITCPLCEGTRHVEDKDEDFMLKHPWKVNGLIRGALRKHEELRRQARDERESLSGESGSD